ncbi:hypothetical protein AB1Y20_011070 [Prymnesium parvum]|uniref:4a-hydroxytetrahydrobiopterin dehydratase n=1 Tax=Prymnesium parvum TaxID=97485 RepID=A0AB34ILU5_PRYPA
MALLLLSGRMARSHHWRAPPLSPRLLPPDRLHALAMSGASAPLEAMTAAELATCSVGGCCGKDTPRLSEDDVRGRLPALPRWTLSADGKTISRAIVAKNWSAAMDFFNAISAVAEAEGHHPDLHLTNWREVRIDLTTHAIGGLSLPDFILAAKIDTIPVECSPKWLASLEAPKGP